MKRHTYTAYQYDELSDEAKQKALETMSDINTDYEWYRCTQDEAGSLGIDINTFDLYGGEIDGKLMDDGLTICKKIIKEHGKNCDTYKTAKKYIPRLKAINQETQEEEYLEKEGEFLIDILEDYRGLLQEEYDYLSSEEAIVETIKCNEYEFTKEGKRQIHI